MLTKTEARDYSGIEVTYYNHPTLPAYMIMTARLVGKPCEHFSLKVLAQGLVHVLDGNTDCCSRQKQTL